MNYTIVTGATSDIGKQICRTLSANGHFLLMTDVDETALLDFQEELGRSHLCLPLDLSSVEECKDKLKLFVKDSNISVTGAVFAAGIFAIKPFRTISYDFIKRNFDIALFSIIAITQVLTSKKVNSDNLKSIVMLSSVSAQVGTKGYTIYSAVKSSMIGLMVSLAAELAPTTRVNAILPGGIRTKTTNFIYENQEANNPRYLLGDGSPLDIANMVDFLMSEKSRWITGQQFVVDGGYLIG